MCLPLPITTKWRNCEILSQMGRGHQWDCRYLGKESKNSGMQEDLKIILDATYEEALPGSLIPEFLNSWIPSELRSSVLGSQWAVVCCDGCDHAERLAQSPVEVPVDRIVFLVDAHP